MSKMKRTKPRKKRDKKPGSLTPPINIKIKAGKPIKLNIPPLINPDDYIVVKYWGENGLYGWVVCKNIREEISPSYTSKEKAYCWLADHKKDLSKTDKYIVVKYLSNKGLLRWIVLKNKNEEISQAFDSREKAYEWLQNYENEQTSEKHTRKSIIIPDYWL